MAATVEQNLVVQHEFKFKNYKVPTKCCQCNNLLMGFTKQGLHCKRCKQNVHSSCEEDLQRTCIPVIIGQHNFIVKSFKTPTNCDYCTSLLKGFSNQGLKCSECRAIVHENCSAQLDPDCVKIKKQLGQVRRGEEPEEATPAAE